MPGRRQTGIVVGIPAGGGFLRFAPVSRLMECHSGCGACCIALSISSSIPGMPHGKAAGERCVQLTDELRCAIFGRPERPAVCSAFQAEPAFCGANGSEAMELMRWLESSTLPEVAV